ncbi:hypothetical protein [Streptomyces sp. NBC_01276]|uniref:hypothetical protein n=1 Tax=Streptomyces sp. NBC_01276 TaxID=2903808 RepID=UPI002F907B63
MRHVRSTIDTFIDTFIDTVIDTVIGHALHTVGTVLSLHPSPEVHFLGQVAHDLASSEAVRLWVRTTAHVYRTRLTARRNRRDDR